MPAVVTTILHAPTLDQLSPWGTLDGLFWSLDHEYWTEADLFRLTVDERAKGAATARGQLALAGLRAAAFAASGASLCPALLISRAAGARAASMATLRPALLISRAAGARVRAGEFCNLGRAVFSGRMTGPAKGKPVCVGQNLCRARVVDEARAYTAVRGILRGHIWTERIL